jgi:predicted secreted protein
MTTQVGRALALQVDISGTYTNICRLNERSLTLSNGVEEVTAPDCTTPTNAVIQEFMYGVQGLTIDGTLFYNDTAGFNAIVDAARQQTLPTLKLTIPGYGNYVFTAVIEEIQFTGAEKGGLSAKLKARSSGALTFTAAA